MNLFGELFFYLSLAAYAGILFHWIELYNLSIRTIKKENMLQSINVNYKGKSVTIEEIIKKVNNLRKLRFPFIGVVCLMFVISVVRTITSIYGIEVTVMSIILYVYTMINWFGLSLGYLVYGRKLVALMPNVLTSRMKILTYRLTILCIVGLVSLIIIAVCLLIGAGNTGEGYISIFYIIRAIIMIASISMIMMFTKLNRKWPFIFENHQALSKKSTEDPYSTESFKEINSSSNYI